MKVEKRVLKQWQLMDDKNVHNSTIKVSFSNKIMFGSARDSDHDGLIRIFIGHLLVIKH